MFTKTFALSLLACAACASAHATTAIDNLSKVGNPAGVQSLGTVEPTIGQSFVTGTTPLSLTDVVFPQIIGTVNEYSGSETFSLYTNNPVTNLPLAPSPVTFTLDNNTTLAFGADGFGQTTALPNATMLLLPSTRYWLVLTASPNATWDFLPSSSYASALGVTIPATNASYTINPAGVTTAYPLSDGPQQFELDVNAVPEPSSVALLTLASVGAFLCVRRSRAVKTA